MRGSIAEEDHRNLPQERGTDAVVERAAQGRFGASQATGMRLCGKAVGPALRPADDARLFEILPAGQDRPAVAQPDLTGIPALEQDAQGAAQQR